MDGLVQQAIEQQLLSVAQRVEDQLDEQLHAIDKLDADDIEALRERRLQVRHAASRCLCNPQKGSVSVSRGTLRTSTTTYLICCWRTQSCHACHWQVQNSAHIAGALCHHRWTPQAFSDTQACAS
jgi:hypothetical protein